MRVKIILWILLFSRAFGMTDHFSPKEVSCLTAWYPLAATRHRVVAYFGCFTENLPHMADVSDVPCFSSYPHRKRKLRVLCKRFWRFSVLQMHFVSCSRVKLWFFELAFDRGRLVWGVETALRVSPLPLAWTRSDPLFLTFLFAP